MSPTMPERMARLEAQTEHQTEKLDDFRVEAREDIVAVRLDLSAARIEVAALKADVADLKADVEGLHAAVEDIRVLLTQAKDILTQAKGGWRVLLYVGGGLSLAVSAAWWLYAWLAPILPALPR